MEIPDFKEIAPEETPVPHVSTGISGLDDLLGPRCPGFPVGRITQIWGPRARKVGDIIGDRLTHAGDHKVTRLGHVVGGEPSSKDLLMAIGTSGLVILDEVKDDYEKWSPWMAQLHIWAQRHNTAILGVCQELEGEPQGGMPWKYYSSVRIHLEPDPADTFGKVHARIFKNHPGHPGEGVFALREHQDAGGRV